MRKPDGGPAFPRPHSWDVSPSGMTPGDRPEALPEQNGMSLRDAFAIAALPLAWAQEVDRPTGPYSTHMEPTYAGAAARAFNMADAMIAERAK